MFKEIFNFLGIRKPNLMDYSDRFELPHIPIPDLDIPDLETIQKNIQQKRSDDMVKCVEEVKLIKVIANKGKGVENNPFREVTQYWTKEGKCLVEIDPLEDDL